jgi:hypothetical protein
MVKYTNIVLYMWMHVVLVRDYTGCVFLFLYIQYLHSIIHACMPCRFLNLRDILIFIAFALFLRICFFPPSLSFKTSLDSTTIGVVAFRVAISALRLSSDFFHVVNNQASFELGNSHCGSRNVLQEEREFEVFIMVVVLLSYLIPLVAGYDNRRMRDRLRSCSA